MYDQIASLVYSGCVQHILAENRFSICRIMIPSAIPVAAVDHHWENDVCIRFLDPLQQPLKIIVGDRIVSVQRHNRISACGGAGIETWQ